MANDAALAGLLGAGRVYDDVPENIGPPYVVMADIESRGAGSDLADGQEHRFALNVWSREAGLGQALNAAAHIAASLDGADLTVAGHRLANLRWLATDARRAGDGRHRMAQLRFRALTEPD